MNLRSVFLILLLGNILFESTTEASIRRSKRSTLKSLEDVLGIKGSPNKRKSKPVKITPPLRLKPGETSEQPPGWKHCIKTMRATLNWKVFKSPGYPDFLESQIQCSWILEAPIGMRVKIAFRDLDMIGATGSCAKQFVQIIDVSTGKSQGRFCGGSRPGDYVTLGTFARIDLQADKAVTKVRGFLISFMAVKEIPGFRSSKIFPSMGKGGGEGAPGKVDMKNFLSKSGAGMPKSSPGSKRASRRLVYDSDRNPSATDPSITTESNPANTVGSDDDLGWIGNDADINIVPRAPSGGPLKVRPGGNRGRQNNPRPTRPRPTRPTNSGPIIITQSTPPVRIRAKKLVQPSTTPPEYDPEEVAISHGPVIYGADNQPYDSSLYTTLHPVRGNKFVDHRPEVLTTTNLIIIIACGGLFLLMLAALILFWWFYRKRRIRKRKKRQAELRNKKKEEEERMNLNVINLSAEGDQRKIREIEMQEIERRKELPLVQSQARDSPPRYPGQRESRMPGVPPPPELPPTLSRQYDQRGREELRHELRHEMPSHIQLRQDEFQNKGIFMPSKARQYQLDMQRRSGYGGDKRHHTIDPRRHQQNMTSQFRHQSLDPRNLERDHEIGIRLYPNTIQRGGNFRHKGEYPREPPRPYPNGITGVDDLDEDYESGVSDNSGSGKAAMRREYSPWELEQQKRERKKKLIAGEI